MVAGDKEASGICGAVTLGELLPSSSPWHKQAGCPCSSCGRRHYSLERKAPER